MIKLDKSKPYHQVFSSDPSEKVRFIQDDVPFDASEVVIGDPVAILRDKREKEVQKARDELKKREAELNREMSDLGINVPDEAKIRAELEAKIRAEFEAKLNAESVAKTEKPSPKKPGPVATKDTSEAA